MEIVPGVYEMLVSTARPSGKAAAAKYARNVITQSISMHFCPKSNMNIQTSYFE